MLFLLLSQLALAANPNLFVNGNFTDSNGCKETACFTVDQSLIAPWKVTSANGFYEFDPPAVFQLNHYALDLNAGANNTMVEIEQTVPTSLGSTYRVSFQLNQNSHCGPS